MSDRPIWMDYTDLATKVAVPVAVLIATMWFNHAAEERRALTASEDAKQQRRQECIDNRLKLTTTACQDESCTVKGERAVYIVELSQITADMCEAAGVRISKSLARTVASAVAASGDAEATGQTASALGVATPVEKATTITAAPIAAAASEQAGPAPRVYIQIAEEAQRAGARDLITRLTVSRLKGRKLIGMGPELVSRVTRDELRCMKASDCSQASGLATYLGLLLGRKITPVDLSARYENSAAVRPGHYELWLAPGPFSVVPLE